MKRAFCWAGGAMASLGVLREPDDSESEAVAASADGSVVVGRSAGWLASSRTSPVASAATSS